VAALCADKGSCSCLRAFFSCSSLLKLQHNDISVLCCVFEHSQDYRRLYNLEPLVKEDLLSKEDTRIRATVG
jgi:hypothetical protein